MNKILDLRFVIGLFFTVVGVLLFAYSFSSGTQMNLNKAIGWDEDYNRFVTINRWCGIVFTIFGVLMIILSFAKDAGDELTTPPPPGVQ